MIKRNSIQTSFLPCDSSEENRKGDLSITRERDEDRSDELAIAPCSAARPFTGGEESENRKVPKTNKRYVYFWQQLPQSVEVEKLDPKTVKLLGYLVWRMEDDANFKEFRWLSVSSDTWRSLLGERYSEHIKEAEAHGILEHYETSNGVSYSKQLKISKKYRFTKHYEAERRNKQFTLTYVKHPRQYYNGKSSKTTISVSDEEYGDTTAEPDHPLPNQTLKKLERAYDKITLVDEWQDQLWPNGCETKGKKKARRQKKLHYWADHKWATQIGEGEISAKQSVSGRVTHPLILMRKALRPFVRYDGAKLAYVDMKSAHPYLLAHYITNCDERERWLKLCKTDIYSHFGDRAKVKKYFQTAISYSPKGKGKVAVEIHDCIEKEFPVLHSWLDKQCFNCKKHGRAGNTVQYQLQSIESQIFVQRGFYEFERWSLPMHDGLALRPEDLDEGLKHLRKISSDFFGFELEFEVTY
jgi:hypothetical protein